MQNIYNRLRMDLCELCKDQSEFNKIIIKLQILIEDRNDIEKNVLAVFFLLKEMDQISFYNMHPEFLLEDFYTYSKEHENKMSANSTIFNKWMEFLKMFEDGEAPNVTGAGVATDIPFKPMVKIERRK